MKPLTTNQKNVLQVFKEADGELRPHDAALKLGYTESAPISNSIRVLVKRNLLIQTQKGKAAKYKSV